MVCLTHWAAQFNDPPSSEKRPPENLHLAAAEDKTSPACYFFALTISKYYFLFVFVGWWRGTNQVQGIQGSRQHVWRPWLVSQIHPSRSTRIFSFQSLLLNLYILLILQSLHFSLLLPDVLGNLVSHFNWEIILIILICNFSFFQTASLNCSHIIKSAIDRPTL